MQVDRMEIVKLWFDDYVLGNYNIRSNPKMRLKYQHAFRVQKECRNIATSLNLPDEQVFYAGVMGLLHDISRFEQLEKFNTLSCKKSIDHTLLTIQILEETNILKNVINNERFEEIIKTAIYYHNKKEIPEFKDKLTDTFVKILRDADKIDTIRVVLVKFESANEDLEEIGEDIYMSFLDEVVIDPRLTRTKVEDYIKALSWVFDLNFEYSFNEFAKFNFSDRMIKLNIKNPVILEKMNHILTKIQDYLKKKKFSESQND